MKIGVVGNGLVGSTAAYAFLMRGIGGELVLVDKDRARRSSFGTAALLLAISLDQRP